MRPRCSRRAAIRSASRWSPRRSSPSSCSAPRRARPSREALDAAGIEFIGAQPADVSAGTVWLPGHARGCCPPTGSSRSRWCAARGFRAFPPMGCTGSSRSMPTVVSTASPTRTPSATPPTSRSSRAARLPAGRRGAANIAARHGAGVAPSRFEPVLRASLLTGDGLPIALGAATEGVNREARPAATSRRTCSTRRLRSRPSSARDQG